MRNLIFKKIISLDSLPNDWELLSVAIDWSGLPLLLMAKGKGPRPESAASWDAQVKWWNAKPTALQILSFKGISLQTTLIERRLEAHAQFIQPYEDGWIIGTVRGGTASLYGPDGAFTEQQDFGDAIADLQTLPNGQVWVSYFDEGVYGSGISTEGLVCFDGAGEPIFRYREKLKAWNLPFIDDCDAMNVSENGDVWVNYYRDFPLVLLRDMQPVDRWLKFGSLGSAFAVQDRALFYFRDLELKFRTLDAASEAESVVCVDEDGNELIPTVERHLRCAARGGNLVLNTGSAIYLAAA